MAKLTWSRETPAEDGWYWRRFVDELSKTRYEVVYVADFRQRGSGPPERFFRDGYGTLHSFIDDSLFAGPLKPPARAELERQGGRVK